eukprot:7038745-Pyramimonas_sp.AAC.1
MPTTPKHARSMATALRQMTFPPVDVLAQGKLQETLPKAKAKETKPGEKPTKKANFTKGAKGPPKLAKAMQKHIKRRITTKRAPAPGQSDKPGEAVGWFAEEAAEEYQEDEGECEYQEDEGADEYQKDDGADEY